MRFPAHFRTISTECKVILLPMPQTHWIRTGRLKPTPPFDFTHTLSFLSEFAPTLNEQALASRTLTKAVMLAGQPIVLRVAASGSVEAPVLDYTLYAAAPLDPGTERAAIDRLTFWLSLNDNLRPLYAIGAADPAFASVMRRLYGYHQVKFLTPYENTCWALLTQRTPMSVARSIKQALMEQFGADLRVDDEVFRAFPEPGRVAAAGQALLTTLVGNERKAAYLLAASAAFADVDETWLRSAPYAEVEAWLRAIAGVGAWSATFVLLRGLGRMERLPSEKRLIDSVAKAYGTALDQAMLEQIGQRYGPYQGYWAHYLRIAA